MHWNRSRGVNVSLAYFEKGETVKRQEAIFEALLPPDQAWFTPKEVAGILGRSEQYVRDCFDNQTIMGHCLRGSGRGGRRFYQVSRRCLLLYLLETANFTADDFRSRLLELNHQSGLSTSPLEGSVKNRNLSQ